MLKIIDIRGREVIDSRGNPTVEAEVGLEVERLVGYDSSGAGKRAECVHVETTKLVDIVNPKINEKLGPTILVVAYR